VGHEKEFLKDAGVSPQRFVYLSEAFSLLARVGFFVVISFWKSNQPKRVLINHVEVTPIHYFSGGQIMRRIFFLMIVLIITFGLTVSTHAMLSDLGGGLIYDDVLKITWLQDANWAKTSGYNEEGYMTWDEANNWLQNLTYQGITGWRLPGPINPSASPCSGSNCTDTEVGYLYYITLGNTYGNPTNSGPFQNIIQIFWTGWEFSSDKAWSFNFFIGGQQAEYKSTPRTPWAVHDGMVTPIPIPSTLLLLSSGLLGLAGFRRKFWNRRQ
jgi:hypothetical protein